jgi:hypothetical protein
MSKDPRWKKANKIASIIGIIILLLTIALYVFLIVFAVKTDPSTTRVVVT